MAWSKRSCSSQTLVASCVTLAILTIDASSLLTAPTEFGIFAVVQNGSRYDTLLDYDSKKFFTPASNNKVRWRLTARGARF